MTNSARILFVGLGSPHGDDQIGWRVAEELLPHVANNSAVSVRKAAIPLDLMDWLVGIDRLHICDACCTGEPIGTVVRMEAPSSESNQSRIQTMEQLRTGGSHDFGLAAVLDLAARLGRLPEKVVVHAVTGRRYDAGATMRDELADAVPKIARTLLEEMTDARNVTRAVAAASG